MSLLLSHIPIRSDQIRSVSQLCLTICDPMNRSTPGLPVYHQLRSSLRLTSIESGMPSSYLILCCPLLLLPSTFPSIRVFSNELSLCIRWPESWNFSFSFSISPSNEYTGLISFRIDWFDLLACRGPAPADPGSSKRGPCRRGSGYNSFN